MISKPLLPINHYSSNIPTTSHVNDDADYIQIMQPFGVLRTHRHGGSLERAHPERYRRQPLLTNERDQ
jgi:hypothetical protein